MTLLTFNLWQDLIAANSASSAPIILRLHDCWPNSSEIIGHISSNVLPLFGPQAIVLQEMGRQMQGTIADQDSQWDLSSPYNTEQYEKKIRVKHRNVAQDLFPNGTDILFDPTLFRLHSIF